MKYLQDINQSDKIELTDNAKLLIIKTRDERIKRLQNQKEGQEKQVQFTIDYIKNMSPIEYLVLEGIHKPCDELKTKFIEFGFSRIIYDFNKPGWHVGSYPERYVSAKEIIDVFT